MADQTKPELDGTNSEIPAEDLAPDAQAEDAGATMEDAPPMDEAEPAEPESPELEVDAQPPEQAPQPTAPTSKGAGIIPSALIGGGIAALLGFAIAETDVLDPLLPWAEAEVSVEMVEQLTDDLKALNAKVDGIAIPDLGDLEQAVAGLDASVDALGGLEPALDDLNARVAALDERLTALEKAPLTEGVSEAAIAAYEAELAAAREEIQAQKTEIANMIGSAQDARASAEASARAALARTALAELRAALDAGAGYAGQIAVLRDGGVEVPAALAASAATGVTTLAALQQDFPPVARAALADLRAADPGDGGLGSFLTRHLGARSVTPRDGDDPDAVLSRAEAALRGGDMAAALNELSALPPEAEPALAGWVDRARERADTLAAAEALAQRLNSK